MTRNDHIRARLDGLIRDQGADYAALSRLLGRNPSYVQQFIKYGVPRRLAEEDRRLLADYFGVSEQELGKSSGTPTQPLDRAQALPDIQPAYRPAFRAAPRAKNLVEIPYFNIGASAGAGAALNDEQPEQQLIFDAGWARSLASGNVSALSFVRVQGDSMVPTLNDGEQIIVDTADTERIRDGIYVLRIDDALYVKRLAVNPISKRLSIISDNPLHSQWPDCDPTGVDLIGRVVWVGRRL